MLNRTRIVVCGVAWAVVIAMVVGEPAAPGWLAYTATVVVLVDYAVDDLPDRWLP